MELTRFPLTNKNPEEVLIEEAVKRKRYFQLKMISWAKKNLRNYPWRRKISPYSVLVAEILLKRTTATAVERVFPSFLEKYPNIKSLAGAKRDDLKHLMATLGYHKERSKIFIRVAQHLERQYDGKIPNSKEALMEIPYIGQYTAGAILSMGYGKCASMVDSNIERILRRFFCTFMPNSGKQRWVLRVAGTLVPAKNHMLYNLGLVDHGALVCRYGKPRCPICPLTERCDYLHISKGDQLNSA